VSISVRVPVAPALLRWAASRSGREPGDIENHFSRWDRWVSGAEKPTLRQLENVARYTHVPFGVFFLNEPPAVELPIPDFRRTGDRDERTPSQDLLAVIQASQRRQDWFRDYALALGLDPSPAVGAARGLGVPAAAALATELLRFGVTERPRRREEVRHHLRHVFEELGGLAVFSSMVGNDTHRLLDRDEFRGFTLADPLAPLVFINARDTLSGQTFTFLHEFAHVLRAESGVSDEDPARTAPGGAERWCNAVAAEVLVPRADLARQVEAHPLDGSEALDVSLDRLAGRYQASTLVVLLRLHEMGAVRSEGFAEVFDAERARVERLASARQDTSGGGDFYNNQPFRVGERLARAVISDTYEGRTSYTDALALLGFSSVSQIDTFATRLGMR